MLMIKIKEEIIKTWQLQTVYIIPVVLCTMNMIPNNIHRTSKLLNFHTALYRVSQEECEILRESVSYVKLYRYNPKHLYQKLNGYGDNGQRSLKF